MSEELKPCPFCGAGATHIKENGRVWIGTRYSEPTSVSINHWCPEIDGQPSRRIERVGRDEESAIAAWNRRAAPSDEAQPPMQPLVQDQQGTVRFKENAIVRHLLDKGGLDMNALAILDFTDADREQFAQLIGYSVGGYGELSYVSDESYERAAAGVDGAIAAAIAALAPKEPS